MKKSTNTLQKNSTALKVILSEISLLPDEEFDKVFYGLFKEKDLAGKTLTVNSYQRMYRYLFQKERFDSLQRQHFETINIPFLDLPITNPVMKWSEGLSKKYNQAQAVEYIKNRFKHSYHCLYLTIEKLKADKGFAALIRELRTEGWLDWQIILAMMNFMLNYKVNLVIDRQNFKTEEEFITAFNKVFHDLKNKDEKDCYVKFPLKAFQSVDFRFQMNNTMVLVLKAFGLENKSRFPNFQAVKEFLDIRFNMKNDHTDEGNPLSDIDIN